MSVVSWKYLGGGDVTAYFVEAAKQLPQVQRILLLDEPGEERRVWTYIVAPYEEPDFGRIGRRPVYDAFGEAIDHGTELVDFRLINVQEFNYPVDRILPGGARVLFDRKNTT